MKKIIVCRTVVAICCGVCSLEISSKTLAEDTKPIYLDAAQPLEPCVEDLLSRLTLEEKISIVHANSKFTTAAIPRLGIPRRWLDDGPHGVREDIGPDTWAPAGRTDDFSTAMPAGICLAATWNPELGFAEGEAIGQEARWRGKDIMLGPGVNILRTPLCGRNFEYLGEDPFLSGVMCSGYIRGEQSQDISSCVKHFALNNQETDRGTVNVEVDERALREIYLPAFKAAVEQGGVWSVMGAYNELRGQHCCHNDYLLNKILKDEWGFKGLVMSDWDGTHDTKQAALNGLDLEMGTEKKYDDYYLAQPYLNLLKTGELPLAGLDEKVRRNLRVMIATHVFDADRKKGSFNTAAHQDVARQVAEEGIVLLKNEKQLLPLDDAKLKTIAVIGENAIRLHAHGGDSSGIKAFYEVNPLDGIVKRAGKNVNVIFSEGYEKNAPADLAERAIAAAKSADVVIYIGGLNHDKGFDCEGADRKDMKLPYGQDGLIQKIVAANPKTVVVLEGTMVEMGAWLGKIPALLQAWYPGMEGGNALAKVLFGDVNPSGKLPCTFPKKLSDSPAHQLGNFPGVNGTVTYAEGLLVGYRWFDTKNIEPQFPFGYGLSYTTFKYSDLKLIPGTNETATAQFEIENTGTVAGAEVAQLYVHEKNPNLLRPEKELKGFKKVFLKPGEKQTISIPLDKAAFSYYDDTKKSWVAQDDGFEVLVGSSSRDIRLRDNFHYSGLKKTAHVRMFNVYPPYWAFKNNWSGREIGWHPGTEEAPQWTASFDFSTNQLYGYPASGRGWHYGWNPTGDDLFPKKISDIGNLPCNFSWDCGGDDLHGDFAYDLFLRNDDKKSSPQLEVMVWGANNSTPIGQVISTNILEADGVSFDLWAGTNAPAGYYVYSFAPHQRTDKLGGQGGLNVDMIDFFNRLKGRENFSPEMQLDVVEAGFEIVRGRGWATCGWFSCEAN
jgi:beta-glucosidase